MLTITMDVQYFINVSLFGKWLDSFVSRSSSRIDSAGALLKIELVGALLKTAKSGVRESGDICW